MSKHADSRKELPPGARWRGKRIQVRVYRGYDAAKKRPLYATGTAGTVSEAWKLWTRLSEQVEQQTYVQPKRVTVSQHMAEWLEKVAKPDVKPRTYESYEAIVRNHINPHIGDIALNRLTPKHVDELMAKLKGTMSETTRKNVFRVLNRGLNIAVRWEIVNRNVCQAVEAPTANEPEFYIMTAKETNALLKALDGDRLYPLYLTAIYTGMRRGELLGLRWIDVNFTERYVWVRQALQTPGLNPVFTTPKNSRTRYVPLAPVVMDALQSQRITQELERAHYGFDYRDYGLVFTQPNGAPINGGSLVRNHWKDLKERAGLPSKVRFHDLRHTFISRALAAGANPRAVSDIVGHHDPGFTMRRYAHTHKGDREEAVHQLADYLGPDAGTSSRANGVDLSSQSDIALQAMYTSLMTLSGAVDLVDTQTKQAIAKLLQAIEEEHSRRATR